LAAHDVELGKLVCDGLATAGIPVRARVLQTVSKRLAQAYPIYRIGYESHFADLDNWLGGVDGVLSFGVRVSSPTITRTTPCSWPIARPIV